VKDACSEANCTAARKARGLCNKHYQKKLKAGDLTASAVVQHRLSKTDLATRLADSSVCGPNVPIVIKSSSKGPRARCKVRFTEFKRRETHSVPTPDQRRKDKLRQKYGITQSEYLEMFNGQNGLCAICLKPSSKKLLVDHNHMTGKVRGLLCRPCNFSLGFLRDNYLSALRAAMYLMDHS